MNAQVTGKHGEKGCLHEKGSYVEIEFDEEMLQALGMLQKVTIFSMRRPTFLPRPIQLLGGQVIFLIFVNDQIETGDY